MPGCGPRVCALDQLTAPSAQRMATGSDFSITLVPSSGQMREWDWWGGVGRGGAICIAWCRESIPRAVHIAMCWDRHLIQISHPVISPGAQESRSAIEVTEGLGFRVHRNQDQPSR
jgi:hypothetical protein